MSKIHLPRLRRRGNALAYGGLSLALLAGGAAAYGAIGPAGASTTSNTRVVTAQMGTVTQSVSATGNLQPVSSLAVGFAAPGTVSEIDVQVGQQVSAGQVLAKLDPTAAQASLQVAQLNLTSAEDKLATAEAGTTMTTGGGPSSPAQTVVIVDPSAVASAEAAVVQAQATETAAQKTLDETTLTAPSAGTVTALTGMVGQSVTGSGTSATSAPTTSSTASSGGGATGGSSASGTTGSSTSTSSSSGFLTLIDMSKVQVKAGFAEVDAVKLSLGQPVTITVSAQPGAPLTGTVTEIDPTATVVSNVVTYNALVSVANPPPTVKPGMTASVSVQVASHPNVLEVPTAAIQTRGGTSVVNVDQAGKAVPSTVTTGLQGDTTTEITSGLKAGQQLLVTTGTVTSGAPTTGTGTGGLGGGLGGGTGGLGGGGGFGGGGATRTGG